MTRLTVIIPALNEAHTLPGLLAALHAQDRPPDEIIVADAGSTDGTPALALAAGARVVPGGRPGPGRNAGARAATGDLFLFLDSDVLPGPEFIANALTEFESGGNGVATTLNAPLSDSTSDQIIMEATNLYLQVVQHISPHAPGYCIFCRRAIHEAIGGFDEKVKLAEDHNYVQRAAQLGQFAVLTHACLAVSMRRIEKEGLARLAFKYLWCEMYALAGKPIYSTPFEYEFGAFGSTNVAAPASHSRRLIDVGQLRQQLGQFDNPLLRLNTAAFERLDRLLRHEEERAADAWERFQLQLDPPELAALRRYLHRRLALTRLTSQFGQPVRDTVARLQTAQHKERSGCATPIGCTGRHEPARRWPRRPPPDSDDNGRSRSSPRRPRGP